MSEGPPPQLLGVTGNVQVFAAETDTPWTLPIDALVLPVDATGFGQLAQAYVGAFPDVLLTQTALQLVTPEKPFLASVVPPPTSSVSTPTALILATSRPGGTGVVDMSAVAVAVRESIALAVGARLRRLGVPLLSTGAGGLPVREVARATFDAVRAAGRSANPGTEIVLFDQREGTVRLLAEAWGSVDPSGGDDVDVQLSGTAQRVLDRARVAAGNRMGSITPDLIWFEALAQAADAGRRDVATILLDAVAAALGTNDHSAVLRRLASLRTIPRRDVGRVPQLLDSADMIGSRVASRGYVRQRHLLAAAVLEPDAGPRIDQLIGWPSGGARDQLRAAIAKVLPTEFPEVWDEILASTARPAAASPTPTSGDGGTAFVRAQAEARIEAPAQPPESSSDPENWQPELKAPAESPAETMTSATPTDDPLAGSLAQDDGSGDLAGGISADLVDPDRGIPLDQDHLGVGTYVTMLATVIADRDTPLPLSIGLFGEWGSGKSYFMGLLRQQIDDLSKADDSAYLSGIEHIGFNAWHYADTNLWASLGNTIFEKLAGTGQSNDARRVKLRAELIERLDRRQELDEATARAQRETETLRADLAKARTDRASAGRNLLTAMAGAAEVGPLLDTAWRRLGVKDEVEQTQLLVDETRGLRHDGDVLRRASSGLRAVAIAAVLFVSLALVGIGLVTPPSVRHWLAGVGVAGIAGSLAAAAAVVGRVRKGVESLSRAVAQTRERSLARADAELHEWFEQLNQALIHEQALVAQRDEAVARVGQISRELADLDPGRQWYGFLAERVDSTDYRGQLGLVSTIRRDFTKLIALMQDWREHPDEHGDHAPINRIVLYIDDLDRCSPNQVMDVLQAVHLLLALDLFVVVVGVDPRWLLQSLRQQYRGNFAADDPALTKATATPASGGDAGRAVGGGEWAAEPLDYLEKIFNIPFVLPRMTTNSFATLIREISADTQRASEQRRRHDDAALAMTADGIRPAELSPGGGVDIDWEVPFDGNSEAAAVAGLIPVEAGSAVALAQAGRSAPARRGLTEGELRMLGRLGSVVESPREAKRLLNLYRTLRSTRDLSSASDFLERSGGGGEYQAVIVLLGVLSARPELLGDLLGAPAQPGRPGGICGRGPDATWAEVVAGLRPRPAMDTDSDWENDLGPLTDAGRRDWQVLLARLAAASEQVTLPDLAPFQAWGPRIARFSFVLSPLSASVH